MGRRINPRLTYSEYVSPHAEESTAVEIARRDLMDAIRRVYRPMLEKLLADVFPAYEQLAQSGFDFAAPGYRELTKASFGGDGISIGSDAILYHRGIPAHTRLPEGDLKLKLEKWAQEFNASEGWFLDLVLQTVDYWLVSPDGRESLRISPITAAPIVPDVGDLAMGERFRFEYEPWDPQWRPWKDYERELRQEFETALSKHETAGRRSAESYGLVPAPRQYDPYDLDAFVVYQFAGKSSSQVADAIKPATDASVVLRRVRAAARLLGWSLLRRVRRGRPSPHKAS